LLLAKIIKLENQFNIEEIEDLLMPKEKLLSNLKSKKHSLVDQKFQTRKSENDETCCFMNVVITIFAFVELL